MGFLWNIHGISWDFMDFMRYEHGIQWDMHAVFMGNHGAFYVIYIYTYAWVVFMAC